MELNKMDMNDLILFAYNYLNKNIDNYGTVKAVTIYDESHSYEERISFCFLDANKDWSEDSITNCLNIDWKC